MPTRTVKGVRSAPAALTALGALTMLVPFVWMALTSFKSPQETFALPLRWFPEVWRWENYVAVWARIPFGRLFVNSSSVALAVVLGQLLTSVLSGFLFARVRFPGRETLFALYIGSMMLPDHVKIVPSFLVLRWLDLFDTYSALTLPFLAGPFGAFLMRQQFLSLPQELEDAAAIEGCSRLGTLFRILVPSVKPALAALAIYVFLFSWNDFLWPLVMTSRMDVRTLPVGLALFTSEMRTDWPVLMAGSTLAALPAVMLVGRIYRLIVTDGEVVLGKHRSFRT